MGKASSSTVAHRFFPSALIGLAVGLVVGCAGARPATARRRVAGRDPVRLAGRLLRVGADLRWEPSRRLALILQGDGITGFVAQRGINIRLRGFRFALHTEVTP